MLLNLEHGMGSIWLLEPSTFLRKSLLLESYFLFKRFYAYRTVVDTEADVKVRSFSVRKFIDEPCGSFDAPSLCFSTRIMARHKIVSAIVL